MYFLIISLIPKKDICYFPQLVILFKSLLILFYQFYYFE